MTYPWNANYKRFDVASNILLQIVDSVYSINNEIEFGVRAYGTMYPAQLQNCTDTRLEVPFNLQNTSQIKTRLQHISAIGSSPIAYSLKQASENELNDAALYDYSVIFITDGGESCNGDVCGIFQQLLQKKIRITPYIIGLDKNDILKTYYACLGNYIEVGTTEDIEKAVKLIIDANRSILEKPKQLNLVTKYSGTPVIKDTVASIVVKDTIPVVKIKPATTGMAFLTISKLPKQTNSTISINLVSGKMEKVKSVTVRFDFIEPKKTPVGIGFLDPSLAMVSLKTAKPSVAVKKSTLKLPKNVSLRFEYEEAKKTSPELARLTPVFQSSMKITKPSIAVSKTTIKREKKASLSFEYEEPKKVSPVLATIVPVFAEWKLPATKSTIIAKRSNLKPDKKAVLHFEIDVPKKEYIESLSMIRYPKRTSYAIRLPETKEMNLKNKKAVLRFTIEEKKVAKKDTVIAPMDLVGNSMEYTTEVTANNETLVQVYFKGTNGKTYPTAKPMIIFEDARTKKEITSFKREMSGSEPVPQKVSAGTYNLVIKGFDDLYANNIVINPNAITKVIVKVSDGTLQFRYKTNIKRPIIEYTAIVNRRFAAGATVKQKCSESKTYEPGTYYVEVNCLPAYKASIDLTFDLTYEIQIDEPGTLAIMNTNKLGKVQIQTVSGDDFLTFYTMNVTGNLAEQRVQLQSGHPFKVLYPIDPSNPSLGNKEVPFRINPDNILELELK